MTTFDHRRSGKGDATLKLIEMTFGGTFFGEKGGDCSFCNPPTKSAN